MVALDGGVQLPALEQLSLGGGESRRSSAAARAAVIEALRSGQYPLHYPLILVKSRSMSVHALLTSLRSSCPRHIPRQARSGPAAW